MLRILVSVLTGFGQMRLEQWKSDAVPGCSDLGDVLWMSMYFSSNLSVQKSLLCIHIFLSSKNSWHLFTQLFCMVKLKHTGILVWAVCLNLVCQQRRSKDWCHSLQWRQACGCLCLCVSDSSGLHVHRGYVAGCCWSAVWIHIHGTVWSWWEDSKSLCWARQQCLGCDEAIIAPWQHCILALGRACFASALVLVFSLCYYFCTEGCCRIKERPNKYNPGPNPWAQMAGSASYHSICRGIAPTGTCLPTIPPDLLLHRSWMRETGARVLRPVRSQTTPSLPGSWSTRASPLQHSQPAAKAEEQEGPVLPARGAERWAHPRAADASPPALAGTMLKAQRMYYGFILGCEQLLLLFASLGLPEETSMRDLRFCFPSVMMLLLAKVPSSTWAAGDQANPFREAQFLWKPCLCPYCKSP